MSDKDSKLFRKLAVMNTILTLLLQTIIAALAVTESGDTLANISCTQPMVTASNMKVITTGIALNELGCDYRWQTTIAYSGSIKDGVLDGDLYIVGGADPTLGSTEDFACPINTTFARWTEFVRSAGIKRIDGHIYGDGRYMDGPMEHQTWLWEDIGAAYGAGVSGLNFYENAKDFNVVGGKKLGDPVTITESYPDTPWMTYKYSGTTGPEGTGDRLYLFTSRVAPFGSIEGTYALGKKPKVLKCSNKYPEYTCAWAFCRYLSMSGITSTKGPDYISYDKPAANEKLTIIGTTQSSRLADVVIATNHDSNNFFADTIFRTLGKERTGSATYASSSEVYKNGIRKLGLNPDKGYNQVDGSGLSLSNTVSPEFMCTYLRRMMLTRVFSTFLDSFPTTGKNGTVAGRVPGIPQEQRERIRMKSGSVNGVRTFCGYILPATDENGEPISETVIFSFMAGNSNEPVSALNAYADSFIKSLL